MYYKTALKCSYSSRSYTSDGARVDTTPCDPTAAVFDTSLFLLD